jgi:alpha-beta hydrolase superfamily lysophospholipase
MRGLTKAILLLFTASAIFVVLAGSFLGSSVNRSVGDPPSDLAAKSLLLRTVDGSPVAGWIVAGQPEAGVVLLIHGVRADRRAMLGRAEFLNRLGYGVLLIDLPGHGESVADQITYGFNESKAVTAALNFLSTDFPSERVGVIAASLGAAALVLSKPDPAPSAVVLEAMFPTIADAVNNRLNSYIGWWASPFAPLLLWQLPLRLGVSPEQLRPIVDLPSMRAPVLFVVGSIDQRTTLAETEHLYEVAGQPKELWVVDGAAHVDLYAFDPGAYEAKVSAFLAKYLRVG